MAEHFRIKPSSIPSFVNLINEIIHTEIFIHFICLVSRIKIKIKAPEPKREIIKFQSFLNILKTVLDTYHLLTPYYCHTNLICISDRLRNSHSLHPYEKYPVYRWHTVKNWWLYHMSNIYKYHHTIISLFVYRKNFVCLSPGFCFIFLIKIILNYKP